MARLFPYPGTSGQLQIYTDSPPYCVDEGTTNVTYIAWLSTAGKQTICKIDETTNPQTMGFAFGTWAERAALTYVDWLTYSQSGDWEVE